MARAVKHTEWMLLAAVLMGSGCGVPQPRGEGMVLHQQEPTTKNWYWLYLPADYVAAHQDGKAPPGRKWPLVVTFHGMRPFDTANAQIREWQEEADRYGYVVIAPETRSCDLLGQFPIHRVDRAVEKDEEGFLAIMDEVFRQTDADPINVLSTSWSMGGYLAHYMVNRHPNRFSCIAVKQSNFSAELLDVSQVPKYRDMKVAVYFTKNDFPLVAEESRRAMAWYQQNGFDLEKAVLDSLGHERTPELAAHFFSKTCGATPKTPPVFARLQVTPETQQMVRADISPYVNGAPPSDARSRTRIIPVQVRKGPSPSQSRSSTRSRSGSDISRRVKPVKQTDIAKVDQSRPQAHSSSPATPKQEAKPRTTTVAKPRQDEPQQLAKVSDLFAPPDETRNRTRTRSDYTAPPPRQSRTAAAEQQPTRKTPSASPKRAPKPVAKPVRTVQKTKIEGIRDPLRVRLSSTIGISPLLVSYTARLVPEIRDGAYCLWSDNGTIISNGVSGQRVLTTPGDHVLEVVATLPDNRQYRASCTVTVLERLATARGSRAGRTSP